MTEAPPRLAGEVTDAPALGPRASLAAATAAMYRAQVARARVARGPLLFVATLQSLGILVLLRGVVSTGDRVTKEAVVAGATILVVAFVALNLLAQRFGALRAARALDHYAALPAPASAVVLGTAASYATFTVPGALLTAVVGALLYGLPLTNLWVLVAVLPLAGVALAGVGALLGLALPRPELATLAGQLGMTIVMFLGVIPAQHFPGMLRGVRAVVPSTFAVDAFAASFARRPAWGNVVVDLVLCGVVATVSLALATRALRRAVNAG